MLDIELIRQQPDKVREALQKRQGRVELVDTLLALDQEWRAASAERDRLRAAQKTFSDQRSVEEAKANKPLIKAAEEKLEKLEAEREKIWWQIPNIPLDDVPVGRGEEGNQVVRTWGQPTPFSFQPKNHLELGTELGILDFEAGAKVAGSQFYYLKGDAVMLEFALVQFALQKLSSRGFTPIITPDLAKSRYYLGTGYQPKGDEAQIYKIEGEDLGLIATAEITIAGLHADEIIPEEKLPIRYAGFSHAFRQEAGAYGKYSQGLYRVHQFSKVEMFVYCLPEQSGTIHQELLALEEELFQELGIPYRVLEMGTGDLGAIAAKKYDVEAWMPGRNDYGEVTSTSNCTDYQSRNLKIRFRRASGEIDYLHMLNGTALAMSRATIAILENYQQADGKIAVPEALKPYLFGKTVLG